MSIGILPNRARDRYDAQCVMADGVSKDIGPLPNDCKLWVNIITAGTAGNTITFKVSGSDDDATWSDEFVTGTIDTDTGVGKYPVPLGGTAPYDSRYLKVDVVNAGSAVIGAMWFS